MNYELSKTAFLSNCGKYTSFSYGDYIIRFRTSDMLERFVKINTWNKEIGYIEVMAKYKDLPVEEEYIDLLPILENLYIEPKQFLENIDKVEIKYD